MSHDLTPRPLNPAAPAPDFPWPGGKRSALFIGFDVDAETAWIGNRPENVDRMVTTSHGGYDARVGIAKVLELLAELDLKATFFIPGWTAEAHTRACEPIVATATPATPMLRPMTLMRSRITFKMEHRMRKYSGVLLSPSARRIDAAALYANCAMPQPQTI